MRNRILMHHKILIEQSIRILYLNELHEVMRGTTILTAQHSTAQHSTAAKASNFRGFYSYKCRLGRHMFCISYGIWNKCLFFVRVKKCSMVLNFKCIFMEGKEDEKNYRKSVNYYELHNGQLDGNAT